MGFIILLSILLLIFIALAILGIVKGYDWDTPAYVLQFIGIVFGIATLIALVILSIVASVENGRTRKAKVESWYNETVLNLDSTKEYISTITDDYVRSLAVKEYNSEVKSFKLLIKDSKHDLDNGWISWYTCPTFKELDENVVDYIR